MTDLDGLSRDLTVVALLSRPATAASASARARLLLLSRRRHRRRRQSRRLLLRRRRRLLALGRLPARSRRLGTRSAALLRVLVIGRLGLWAIKGKNFNGGTTTGVYLLITIIN